MKAPILFALVAVLAIGPVQADWIPGFLNPYWEVIWTFMCYIPIINLICTTCESVTTGPTTSCRVRLVDSALSIDVVLEARTIVPGQSYQVVDDVGGANSKTISIQLDGSQVSIDDGTTATCARILLSYDFNENENTPEGSDPDFSFVDGFPCSEFGTTLLWYMVVEELYYASP